MTDLQLEQKQAEFAKNMSAREKAVVDAASNLAERERALVALEERTHADRAAFDQACAERERVLAEREAAVEQRELNVNIVLDDLRHHLQRPRA